MWLQRDLQRGVDPQVLAVEPAHPRALFFPLPCPRSRGFWPVTLSTKFGTIGFITQLSSFFTPTNSDTLHLPIFEICTRRSRGDRLLRSTMADQDDTEPFYADFTKNGKGLKGCVRPPLRPGPAPEIRRACARAAWPWRQIFKCREDKEGLGERGVAPSRARGRARVDTSMPAPGAASGGAGGCGGRG